MNFVLMGLVGLLAAGALLFLFLLSKKGSGPGRRIGQHPMPSGKQPRPLPPPAERPATSVPAVLAPARATPARPAPAVLLDFAWRRVADLPLLRQQSLLAGLRLTPPPSRAFHQLVSPQFVARASSTELSELVIGEPQVAAKVLARVNSSAYGLQTPVRSIGQAVTFLGLNSVRSICLQYMLSATFKADTSARQQRFDAIWRASAVASELCLRLAQQLRLPDPGTLVTQVVLSFLGHFAASARMPLPRTAGGGAALEPAGLLARAQAQQTQLGVPAAEIGALLLREWALPPGLVSDVADIDRLLVTPPDGLDPDRAAALAVCYLSARLGEKLARGEALDPAGFDLQSPAAQAADPDYFQCAAYLERLPQLVRLPGLLREPELTRALQALLGAVHEPA